MFTWFFAIVMGAVGLFMAQKTYAGLVAQPMGSDRMQDLREQIHNGAMTFLGREYRVLAIFVGVVALLLWVSLGFSTAFAFLLGAGASMSAGFFGMQAATQANVRTSEAARADGQAAALSTAFNGGVVMGLSVASLGLIGVGLLFWWFGSPESASTINGFAMGASSIALFARVGGGIYTKAADVGADLVGKVEAGIPEDDPQ